MRRILFVSCNYSRDFSKMTWGTYIRMQVLLQAAGAAADRLDVLFLVAPDIASTVDPAFVGRSLKDAWGVEATVRFGLRSSNLRGRLRPWAQSLVDFSAQEAYRRSCGEVPGVAVKSAISGDTALVIAHRLDAALACLTAADGSLPVAMNLDSIEYVEMRRRFATQPVIRRLLGLTERLRLQALQKGEVAVLQRCRSLLVCSDLERNHLLGIGIKSDIAVIPNARDFVTDRPTTGADAKGDTLMFFGSYGYPPNVQAAEEMINLIFPLVRASRPDARLLIAGNLIERLPSYHRAGPGIELLRDVVDVGDVYRRAAVACCPIRVGAGTRIKLIEASSWKKPIVSTRVGAEGLDFVDDDEIVLRDEPAAFAEACVRLLDDPARRDRLGNAAFDKARRIYDRPEVVRQTILALQRAM